MEAAQGTGAGFSRQLTAEVQPLLAHCHLGRTEGKASHWDLGSEVTRTHQPLAVSALLIEYEQQAGEGQHSWGSTTGSTLAVKL